MIEVADIDPIDDECEDCHTENKRLPAQDDQLLFLQKSLIDLTHRSRRSTPVGDRRKTALEMIDDLRDSIILNERKLLTDQEVDLLLIERVRNSFTADRVIML